MRLNQITINALQALVYMAQHPDLQLFPARTIAKETGTSWPFLLKALQGLGQQGILASLRGPNGGYALVRPVEEITVLEVVEAVEGRIHGDMGIGMSEGAVNGLLQALADDVADLARKALARVSVADLAGDGAGRKGKGK